MLQEKKRLDDNLAQASEHRQHLQRKIWEREQETTQRMDELGQVARGYSELAEDLGLIPVTARNANGINYELCLNNYVCDIICIVHYMTANSGLPVRLVSYSITRCSDKCFARLATCAIRPKEKYGRGSFEVAERGVAQIG
jgi:SMC interacting uncharacterized protein involved in chromosome segregation